MKTPSKREILVLTGHLCPKCDEFTELVESGECRRKKPSGTSKVGPPLVRRYVEIRGYES